MLNEIILYRAIASQKALKFAEESAALGLLALSNEIDGAMLELWGFFIGAPYNIPYVRHPTGLPEASTGQRTYTTRGGYSFLLHTHWYAADLQDLLNNNDRLDKELTAWAKRLTKGMILTEICDITAGRDARFSLDCPAFVRRDSGEYELFTVHWKEVDGKKQPFFRVFLFADWDTLVAGIAAYQHHGADHAAFTGEELNLSPEDLMQRFPVND